MRPCCLFREYTEERTENIIFCLMIPTQDADILTSKAEASLRSLNLSYSQALPDCP